MRENKSYRAVCQRLARAPLLLLFLITGSSSAIDCSSRSGGARRTFSLDPVTLGIEASIALPVSKTAPVAKLATSCLLKVEALSSWRRSNRFACS